MHLGRLVCQQRERPWIPEETGGNLWVAEEGDYEVECEIYQRKTPIAEEVSVETTLVGGFRREYCCGE